MTGSTTTSLESTVADAVVTTVAGAGEGGAGEDEDGHAIRTQLRCPTGIAVDTANKTVYIADAGNHRIRRIQHGRICTIAGIGEPGFGGDGGPADQARLTTPTGIAIDPDGNLYIADSANHRIRKVDPSGHISTIAGTGEPGFGGDGGRADRARLTTPTGIAIDPDGNLYIADSANHRIRKVDLSGHIGTIAGIEQSGASVLNFPVAVALDRKGAVYVAERGAARIIRIDDGGTIGVLAGPGAPGAQAGVRLSEPSGVAVDEHGDVYIADSGSHRIRKFSAGTISTIAGIGSPGRGEIGARAVVSPLDTPRGVAVDEYGNVFVADAGSHRVRKITLVDDLTAVGGDGQRPAPGGLFPRPIIVRITREGRPVIAVPVTFTITGDTTSGARFNHAPRTRWVARTNMAGEAAAELTAGPTPGTVRIEAAVGVRVAAFTAAVEPPGVVPNPN
ncbi:NHL domain-containing protein [Actinoalloteichus hymeniacidonis]|uniref:NHL repeat protein n=1 Tax=Actinoalloteichus hymeniacidonis TaxID=340345 RepID=A0AAC9MYW8_9PSEU|nr:SMP-30/gluconolactonase/LRE family protein [Actinoalloteichus hymeniacidonis]AOS64813.1 NHL repeat protein [Actinoalloteichus hymeniacidonis]MBB5907113.1 DNA-binding beta-propeller fold protein YncE [Actinoalloteichus hymeniacidonis]